MKVAIYDSLDKIPEADRGDYKLVTEAGSPNYNKYVLDLDPQHPVAVKNTELLAEKSQRDTAQQQAVQAAVAPKDSEITNLKAQLAQAQAQTGLPAGQVAVPADKALILNQYESLGKFEEVKAKVEEHGMLKEQTEAANRKTLLTEAAKAHGLDPDAFIPLAEQAKLADVLERREVPDPKKPAEKVTHFFVKHKDASGADTSSVLGEFVKNDQLFKPFLASLQAQSGTGGGSQRRIPDQGVGDPPKDAAAGQSYINKTYRRPEQKEA